MDNKQNVDIYVYDKNGIHQILEILERITVVGAKQAVLLATVGEYIAKPIKEDTIEIEV